jgi:hypothetical protein
MPVLHTGQEAPPPLACMPRKHLTQQHRCRLEPERKEGGEMSKYINRWQCHFKMFQVFECGQYFT